MIYTKPAFEFNNRTVNIFTLKNRLARVEILNFGGIIRSFCIKTKDGEKDVVLGYDNPEDYIKDTFYLGATVGRVAGRIENARFDLNGKTYNLFQNDGDNSLHGGKVGFNKKVWDYEVGEDFLLLTYISSDGEEGYPTNLKVSVKYKLTGSALSLEYFAESDGDTPLNLTNHAYFNLGGEIKDTFVKIAADAFLPVNAKMIPTIKKKVDNTVFDLRELVKIEDGLNSQDEQILLCGGYDNNFCLNGKGFREVACAKYGNILLRAYTDREGLQFYTGNFLDAKNGKNGKYYGKQSGFCFEMQSFPNAVNNADFPSVILKRGQKFYSKTSYVLSETEE